jgi:hypothetical protein
VSSAPDPDRDLAVIEAALSSGRASARDPRERELEELTLALRDDPPRPDPAFARTLAGRVEEGFARERRFRFPPAMPRVRLLALAGAAAVLLAVVTGIGLLSGGGDSGSDQKLVIRDPAVQSQTTEDLAPPSGGAHETFAAPAPDASSRAASPTRRVERSAQMTLAAAADELQQAADGIGRVTAAHGGYVVSSSFSTGSESTRGGNFVLRVPTAQLETTLGDLGDLGKVTARSESSQDMTAPYRHTQDRLGNLLLERRATIDRLHAATGDEATQLRDRLRRINAEITDLNGQMRGLKRRTVFSTVTVTLEQRRDNGVAGGPRSGPGGALHDALDTLGGALELAIRVIGVALPLALLAALAWLAGAALRRRRREAALF